MNEDTSAEELEPEEAVVVKSTLHAEVGSAAKKRGNLALRDDREGNTESREAAQARP